MGQFDSPSEAALARIKSENLSSSPVDEIVEKTVCFGSLILDLVGANGASTVASLLAFLKQLAGKKDEANLFYFAEALVEDVKRLYRLHRELNRQFDERLNSPKFDNTVASATLHITRTNVEDRLKRLAHLIVNGIKADDLDPEGLDDFMRAAVELKDTDIVLLGKICDSQGPLLRQRSLNTTNWFGNVQSYWNEFVNSGALDASKHLVNRSSFSRLESHGLIQKFREISTAGVGLEPYALLDEGLRFYEHLQEIAGKE